MTSLNAHVLSANEELLLAYGTSPLRLVATPVVPIAGASLALVGQYFDSMLYDWATATAATLTVNGVATTSENGTFSIIPLDTTPRSHT
jgi:hypothetical protein